LEKEVFRQKGINKGWWVPIPENSKTRRGIPNDNDREGGYKGPGEGWERNPMLEKRSCFTRGEGPSTKKKNLHADMLRRREEESQKGGGEN